MLSLRYLFLIFSLVVVTGPQNVTVTRKSEHRDANLLAAVQQAQSQLGSVESELQRQASGLQELQRAATRIEAQRKELVATLDRAEARIAQRLDDIKGDVRRVITLQDVMREDVDKIQQSQLLGKVWLEEQLRHLAEDRHPTASRPDGGSQALSSVGPDVLSSLQVVQATLYALRRTADGLQSGLEVIRANVSDVANLTRAMHSYGKETALTKGYFQLSMQELMEQKSDKMPLIGCVGSFHGQDEERLPRDCKEVQERSSNKSGIYRIRPRFAARPVFAFCDMETEGGGWTVFQRRQDGSVDFLREWSDYKHGFGNVGGEFWLGNENLYLLTHQDLYELRVDLYDFDEGHAHAKYAGFAVGSEREKYMLKLLGSLTAGDAGDGLTYHASLPFSTIDADNDRWEGGHCALDHSGGWWYNQCDASNLNGRYLRGLTQEEYRGVYWHEWQGPSYSLMATQMMVRPMGYGGWRPPAVNVSAATKAAEDDDDDDD